MAAPDHGRRPNVVITGFSVFPGAPVNPTELLARAMAERAGEFADFCRLQSHVLPVEYGAIVRRLAEIARGFEPDIAIHFGLAAEARGFRIERTARNHADPTLPDNAGMCPGERLIAGGPPLFRGTLPADRIEAALSRAGIAAMQDDSAGAYLCNALFYLSRSAACGRFRPAMAGLVHVPRLADAGGEARGLEPDSLVEGARIIVRECVEEWGREGRVANREW